MAALTYQSQLTANTAANSSQQMGQYIQTLAHQQDLLHQNQHQWNRWRLCHSIRAMPAAVSYAQLDADSFSHRPRLPPSDSDEADKWPPTDSDAEDKDEDAVAGRGPPGFATGRGPPFTTITAGQATGYVAPQTTVAEDIMRHHPRRNMSRPLRSRTSRRGMRIGMHVIPVVLTSLNGHTSQTCPPHSRKPDHDIYFARQQYINQGYNCATKNRHKTVFPQM
jgi:hypothetical protein